MIRYFQETKADPRSPKAIDTKALENKITATDKRIISFIKTQEKEILKPLNEEIDLIVKELEKGNYVYRAITTFCRIKH